MKVEIDVKEQQSFGFAISDLNVNVRDTNDNIVGLISPQIGGLVAFEHKGKHHLIDLKDIFTKIFKT